ncbi:phage/conjugal plasmid C-4 type zinc finger TraR family protein [Pseudomonas sp. JUb42]|uniref:TraR/DksA family transcriptional regulator n=1 Tax=Pseudomonas sp. JUb42 TaxID=2940611 RepID=UPI002168440F|nr:TraR/DksA family transcriptional regulator [Pseudomonas sp. JUb42]MCS3467413.1 phage/conjugal plasmid C-4 type zinc finger TraR family protein [Pseudomonas sp. JUb42]
MADHADFANDLTLKYMELGLATRRPANSDEATRFCVDCQGLIPWQRRFAVLGCMRCAQCQTKLELKGAGHAG